MGQGWRRAAGAVRLRGRVPALCRIDAGSGAVTPWVAAEGADVEAWSLSPDGTQLATVVNDRGYGVLRVGEAGSEGAAVDMPRGVVGDLAWSPDSTTLAISASSPTQPPRLFLFDVASRALRTLHQPASPPGVRPFELVEWESFDGRTVPGWFATPGGTAPADGWPVVVWVHGGPAAQMPGQLAARHADAARPKATPC